MVYTRLQKIVTCFTELEVGLNDLSSFLLFLKMGLTFALLQSSGISPVT